jgi:hypothetical protein
MSAQRRFSRVWRGLTLAAVIGCSQPAPVPVVESKPPSPESSTESDAASPVPTDEVAALDGPDPVDEVAALPEGVDPASPPAMLIPAELWNAPAWIYRTFATAGIPIGTGTARGQRDPQHLTTYTLQRHGALALLTRDELKGGDIHGPHVMGPWSPSPTKRYVGTAETQGTSVTLSLSSDTETLTLRCAPATIAVAAIHAVRKPHRKLEDGCGDEGRWVPAATKNVQLLRCLELEPDGSTDVYGRPLNFARAPGIEWLFVNDDCTQQGGGWRRIPADGSVAPPR